MKKITIILVLLVTISCKSQNPVVGLDVTYNTPEGAYYKDLNNELNKFVGTWKFQSTNKELIIIIKKKEKLRIEDIFRDYLIGEYSYKENGIELVNTLSNLSSSQEENMGGSYIVKPNERPKCTSCAANERRIEMYFSDPERKYLQSTIVLRFITNSNPAKISGVIYSNDSVILPYDGAPQQPRVPYGEYVLIKQ